MTLSVKPNYPLLARQMKVQGSVILQALISRNGQIQDLRVVTGPPILASAAKEAVQTVALQAALLKAPKQSKPKPKLRSISRSQPTDAFGVLSSVEDDRTFKSPATEVL